jgi:hypothetical protein
MPNPVHAILSARGFALPLYSGTEGYLHWHQPHGRDPS